MDQGFYIFVPRAKIEGEKVESRVLYSKKVKSEVLSVGKGLCEMSTQVKRVLDDALRLPPIERAELVEKFWKVSPFPKGKTLILRGLLKLKSESRPAKEVSLNLNLPLLYSDVFNGDAP